MMLISTPHSPGLKRGWEAVGCSLALLESVLKECRARRRLVVGRARGSLLAPASLASLTGGCSAGISVGKRLNFSKSPLRAPSHRLAVDELYL